MRTAPSGPSIAVSGRRPKENHAPEHVESAGGTLGLVRWPCGRASDPLGHRHRGGHCGGRPCRPAHQPGDQGREAHARGGELPLHHTVHLYAGPAHPLLGRGQRHGGDRAHHLCAFAHGSQHLHGSHQHRTRHHRGGARYGFHRGPDHAQDSHPARDACHHERDPLDGHDDHSAHRHCLVHWGRGAWCGYLPRHHDQ